MSDASPNLNDVFRAAFEREQAEIRTIVPGTIMSFSRTPVRECSVRIDMLAQFRSGDSLEIPQIDRVPIIWPCGGGFAMDADLAIGEQVLVMVCDRDISGWLPAGGLNDPPRRLLHNISNAVVLPGLRSIDQQGHQQPAMGELYLGADTGQAPWLRFGTIPFASAEIEAQTISLGAAATPLQGAARVGDTVAPGTSMAVWIASITAFANGFAPGTAIPPTDFGSIATGSTKTRVE